MVLGALRGVTVLSTEDDIAHSKERGYWVDLRMFDGARVADAR